MTGPVNSQTEQEFGGAAAARVRLADRIVSRLARVTSSGLFIPEMDGLRFVAIASVVLLHLGTYVWEKHQAVFAHSALSDAARYACLHGGVGVRLFFAISGMLLALPFAQARLAGKRPPSLKRYYLRRLTRLEPTYIINILIAFALTVAAGIASARLLAPHLLASLFYMHDIVYGVPSRINAVAWSLEVEVQFYILAPFLCVVFSIANTAVRRAVIIGATCLSAELLAHLQALPFPKGVLIGQLPFFLVGMLLADYYLLSWSTKEGRRLVWDLLALPAWAVIPFVQHLPGPSRFYLPMAIFVAYTGAFRGLAGGAVFRNRWLVTIGGMCYTIYLYHSLVVSAIGRVTGKLVVTNLYWVNLLVQLALVGLPLLVACSVLFLVFEKPFMYKDWPSRWAGLLRLRSRGAAG
jgi:peptidoglycan/LPS O-acetylase OafA/YrhL